jgi:nucleotide-binding universal stress UspA family protein
MIASHTSSPDRVVNPRQILCAIDLSDVSEPALACAVSLGRTFGASVTALHVFDPWPPLGPLMAAREPRQPEFDARAVTTRELQALLARFASGESGLHLQTAEGNASTEIVRQAREIDADLIVIGTHGRSGFDRVTLGSVAEKVLRKSPCPVLTLPPGAGPLTQEVAFRTILCPVDFSSDSAHALDFAVALASRVDGTVTALHIVDALDGEPEPLTPAYIAEFRRQQRQAAQTTLLNMIATRADAARVTGIVALGRPHREILRVAAEQASDLIVMGVRGRGPVDLTLFGSTANQVVRRATCAVLTIRS